MWRRTSSISTLYMGSRTINFYHTVFFFLISCAIFYPAYTQDAPAIAAAANSPSSNPTPVLPSFPESANPLESDGDIYESTTEDHLRTESSQPPDLGTSELVTEDTELPLNTTSTSVPVTTQSTSTELAGTTHAIPTESTTVLITPFPELNITVTTTEANNATEEPIKEIVAGPPGWAVVLIAVMLTSSLVLTALFFVRRHCVRKRKEERRYLLSEGYFFGENNSQVNDQL